MLDCLDDARLVCNQVRSFDLEARYIETLDAGTMNEIVSRVLRAIDPEET